jgi:hypothetical protein
MTREDKTINTHQFTYLVFYFLENLTIPEKFLAIPEDSYLYTQLFWSDLPNT